MISKEEYIKDIIGLYLEEFKNKGWDLLDMHDNDAIDTIYEDIKEDLF